MKTEEIVRSLRWCGTGTEENCGGCAFEPQCDEDAVGCVGGLCDAAADKIEELVDRCARYAEEIAALRERMRPYEDTGLTADVCAEYRKFEDEVVASGKTFGRLLELLRADTDGRVVVQPCKMGDVLYRASPSGVVVHRVANVVYRGLTKRWYIDTIPNLPYASEELGKTVFLTRDEAEKALEAMK